MSEYIVLNCENCKKPVVKIHSELLARIKKALHYDEGHGPHLYHVSCQGGFERKIDQLKAILESQVSDPENWPTITTETLEDEYGLNLNVQSEQLGFSFDKTGENFVGIVNWKE